MKKSTLNFWINVIILINFIMLVFTGVVLHHFPAEAKGRTIFFATRYQWGSLHWMLSLFLVFFIIVHFVLHWNWVKVSFKKYFNIEPKKLVYVLLAAVLLFGILAPMILTSNMPSRKDFKDSYGSGKNIRLKR